MKLNTIIKKILPKINNSYFYLSLLLLALVIVYLNYPITEAASKKALAAAHPGAARRANIDTRINKNDLAIGNNTNRLDMTMSSSLGEMAKKNSKRLAEHLKEHQQEL